MRNSDFDRMVKGIADIQFAAYEHFGIDYYVEDLEIDDWMTDQIRKCAFYDLIDENVLNAVDEEYNAHWVADIARKEIGA